MKKNKTLVRMLLILTTSCAILLSSLSAFLYKQYSERSIRDAYGISAEQLEQTYRLIEAQLTNVYNYYSRFFTSNSHVFNALYADQFNAEEMYEINKTLKDSMQVSPLVSSVYIVNRNADAAFSSGATVRTIGNFYDTDIVEYLKMSHEINHPVFIPRDVRYRIYDKWEEHGFISVLFSESANTAAADSALIINISQDKIREMLAIKSPGAYTQKMIVDTKGAIVIQTDSPVHEKSITNEAFFRSIQADAAASGYFTEDIQGKKYFITHLESSSILGWFFISIMEYEQLVAGISQLRDAVFMITGIFILLSAIVSLFFIRSLYKPVHRLIHKVKSAGKLGADSSPASEFEFLRDAFDHLTANISGLNHIVNAYKPAKKKELLERLIRDEVYLNKNTEEELQAIGIPPDSLHNLIVMIRIDDYGALIERCSLRDIALYRFAISNITKELMREWEFVEEIESKGNEITFLFGSIDGRPLTMLKETLRSVQDEVEKNLKMSITVAIGSVFSQLSEIRKSYYGALNASNCRIRLGRGALIDQSSVPENGTEPYVYPHDLEKRLLNSLKLEEEDKYNRSLDAFVQSVSPFTYDEVILSLTQLALAVVKTATGEMQVDPERLGVQRSHISKQLADRDTLEEIKLWYHQLYKAIVQAVNERKDSKQDDMVRQLVDYISVHYHDPNLSVESLADQVHLSPNHLRLIFKKQLGKSLSEHITDIRFIQAMRLLRESDERIKNIAEKVGFANTGYFYTSFKKYTGVSAAQYRDDHKAGTSS
ncbi:helix-turn-helix domain-containing protein [Paenibacillus mendelii]|nr:helix-turn-helix domain-containing protein [Paenibacillus mendelii]